MEQAMNFCEVRTRLTSEIKVEADLVHRLSTEKQRALGGPTDYNAWIAGARKAGRAAVKAFEQHCAEHGC